MEKNVIVVDEKGKDIGATYPKRAKGLVKKGRARFIDENKICLACPAEETTEDKIMSDIKIDKTTGEVVETAERKTSSENTSGTKSENAMPTLGYILERIESIAKDSEYIHEALAQLSELKAAGPGDICGQSKADAIAHVVDAREETNRKLLAFYEMLYKDIAKQALGKNTMAEQLIAIIADEMNPDTKSDMLDTVRQILRENQM